MKKWIPIIIIFVLFIPIIFVLAVSDSTNVNLNVIPVCNNNGICEPSLGENESNCPSDCPTTPPGGAVFFPDTTPPIILNLFISKITLNSAEISWETNELTFCKVFFGETQEYEKGTIAEISFYLNHSTELTKLLPETTYHFKISCQDTDGNEAETKDQKFSTLSLPDIIPPANVLDFEAISGDGQITLKWQNPPDSDFKAVKIARSEKFYPAHPEQGITVYNDKGNSFTDTGLTNGEKYYYTAFAYDKAGNYASGAIVSTVPQEPGVPLPPPPLPPPPLPPPPPEIEKIILEDFDFIQENQKLLITETGAVEVKSQQPTTISIPYEKVPEVLKTIMVTLKKEDKSFSFLLRVNKEKTFYEASIIPPEPGLYPLTLTILDYKNQILKQINGQLEILEIKPPSETISWYKKYQFYILLILILIILMLIIIFFLLSKRKEQHRINSLSNGW